MGGSKSNTGIKPLDNAADTVSNFVDTTAKSAMAEKADAYKNFAYSLKTGNYNNLLETGAKTALFGKEGMKAVGMNPDNYETTLERVQREGDQQAASDAQAAGERDQQQKLARYATILEGSARQRMMTPGATATLLNRQGTPGNTLLTIRGSNGR